MYADPQEQMNEYIRNEAIVTETLYFRSVCANGFDVYRIVSFVS